jgi:hypothetical protein
MKKKINSFSWIHELNESAIEAKMIAEAKLFAQQVNLKEALGDDLSDVNPQDFAKMVMQGLGQTRATTIKSGGGDPMIYRKEKQAKMAAERAALGRRPDLRVSDINRDGSANAEDVKLDALNWEMGEAQSRLPSFGWAHQDATPLPRVHPPAQDFGGMTPNEMTRRANEMRRADEVIDDLYTKMDADAEMKRFIKTAPPGRNYTIQDLRYMANVLGGR